MEKTFIQDMKKTLLDERNQILSALKKKNEDFEAGAKENIPRDFADIASYSTDQDMIESLSMKDIKKLQMIDSALLRIEKGKYGQCSDCNKDISEERLKTLPYALKCIDCQIIDEKKRR